MTQEEGNKINQLIGTHQKENELNALLIMKGQGMSNEAIAKHLFSCGKTREVASTNYCKWKTSYQIAGFELDCMFGISIINLETRETIRSKWNVARGMEKPYAMEYLAEIVKLATE